MVLDICHSCWKWNLPPLLMKMLQSYQPSSDYAENICHHYFFLEIGGEIGYFSDGKMDAGRGCWVFRMWDGWRGIQPNPNFQNFPCYNLVSHKVQMLILFEFRWRIKSFLSSDIGSGTGLLEFMPKGAIPSPILWIPYKYHPSLDYVWSISSHYFLSSFTDS